MPHAPDTDGFLDRALAAAADGWLDHSITLDRPWRAPPDVLCLDARYRIENHRGEPRIRAALGPHELWLDEPVRLTHAEVPKPWGRELWLTGIEARGESGVVTAAGTLPLSQYLALAPRRLTGGARLVLLKVLDPDPDPARGDLYFEVHEEKQEVYVVCHVDPTAWPDGRGRIRYGMNQDLRRRYGDDAAFRRDYLQAVKRYEAVRRTLDGGGDASPTEEAERRTAMEAFTGTRPLAVGDVVTVPPWLPHSLQHGVRVVEFQTPTYERYILSFGQKVVTQDHWDTDQVIDRIRLDLPKPAEPRKMADGAERLVAFDGFRVWRRTLAPGETYPLPDRAGYLLCMTVRGTLSLGSLTLGPEQAALVPGAALSSERGARNRLENLGREPAVALLAAPDP